MILCNIDTTKSRNNFASQKSSYIHIIKSYKYYWYFSTISSGLNQREISRTASLTESLL